ncbi:MAG: NUDIX hydrolase [Actinobacteria bacterium]|nr:NUDIX hydrolase [Actinomycetota bacterium]
MSEPAGRDLHRPTWLDRGFQVAHMAAYWLLQVYWRLWGPTTHGAQVMLWCRGQVLLVRNPYLTCHSAPGGSLRHGESARAAAVRELREEVGISVAPERLVQSLEVTHDWRGKRDHVVIFCVELDERPRVRMDLREVVEAAWFDPDEVAQSNVFPPLKRAIREHVSRAGVQP